MASRAPTLSQPKTKPKVTTKSILSKAKPTVALKPATKPTTKSSTKAITVKTTKAATTKSATKSVTTKSATAQTHAAHPAVAKPKLLKSTTTAKPEVAAVSKATGNASFEAAQPKPRRRKGEVRTRIYWAVFNTDLRRVAVFEFDQRDEAQRRANKLTETSGEHHFIQKIKAIVQP